MSSTTTRLLGGVTVLAGACWAVMAVMGLLTAAEGTRVVLEGADEYLAFGAFALALALTVPAIIALHAHQRGADGSLGRAGTSLAVLGAGGQCVVISSIVVTGSEPDFFSWAAPAAILTWTVGSVMLGVAIRRANVLPRWIGTMLPIVTVFAIVGSEAGTGLLIAVYLAVVGTRLARAAGAGATGVLQRA